MINGWIEKIVLRGVAIGKISEEDIELYKYGYSLFIEKATIIMLTVLIVTFFKAIKELVIFYAIFVPMRSYTGGYHTRKAYKCILLSGSIIIFYIIVSRCMVKNCSNIEYCILSEILLMPCICHMSPAEHKNKPLNVGEKKAYRKIVTITYVIHLILELMVTFIIKCKSFLAEAVLIHLIIFVSLCIKGK